MTLLEQIASETRSGFGQPDNQIATQATANHLYRGLAHDVQGTSGESLLKKAKLDWRVCELPVMIQGKHEVRQFPGRKALVRCDNGAPIEIVSDLCTPHGDQYRVYENGNIQRLDGQNIASDSWRMLSLAHVRLNHSIPLRRVFELFTVGNSEPKPELLYKNGKPQWTVRDLDHGTIREWGNTEHHGVLDIRVEEVSA